MSTAPATARHHRPRASGVLAVLSWTGIGAALIALGVIALAPPAVASAAEAVAGIASAIVAAACVALRPLWPRAGWWIVVIGLMGWTVSHWLLLLDDPVSVASERLTWVHGLAVVSYILLIIGALTLVRRRHTARDTTSVIDSLVVLTAGGALVGWTLLDVASRNPLLGALQFTQLAVFAILNLLLLSVVVRLWFASHASTNRGIRIVSLAFAALMVADLATQYRLAHATAAGQLAPIRWIEVLYALFGVLVAAGAMNADATRRPPGDSLTTTVERSRILALLIVAMLVPTLVVLILSEQLGTYGPLFVLGLVGLLTILMSLRISLLLFDYGNLVTRGRTLTRATDAIADATTPAELDAMAPAWVAALAAQSPARPVAAQVVANYIPADGLAGAASESRLTAEFPIGGTGRTLLVHPRRRLDDTLHTSLELFTDQLASAYDRLALQRRLVDEQAQQRVASLLQQSTDVVALVSADGIVEFITPAITLLTGLQPAEVRGIRWRLLFHDKQQADAVLDRARESYAAGTGSGRGALTTGDGRGQLKHVDVSARWLPDEQHFVVTHHDVTEREELQEALRRQAFHDALTGLTNRVVFREQLGRALARARRSPMEFVVMMIDLDDFKHVNDSLGHPAGDALLRTVANRLRDCLREGDTAARLGGDEFAVILENTWSVKDATTVAERILTKLCEPVQLGTTEVVVGASIGVAVGNASTEDADALARDADLALYQAKYGGKNRYHVYEPSMHADAMARLELTAQLRKALEDDQVTVVYQPIVDLATGGVAGLEALVRWQHPTRGLLPPSEFVALAESSGLITRLGERVLTLSLTQAAAWQRSIPGLGQMRICVNVAGRQLMRDDFVDSVAQAIMQSAIDPSTVVLEVTESVLLPGEGVTNDRIGELSRLGLGIYIDDWGTGWSSLRYLDTLPVSGLKLARDFVAELPDARQIGVARAVLELSNSLQFDAVIAEGVETAEQRDTLIDLGYRLAQGFLFGAPADAGQTAARLSGAVAAPWPVR
ncbi:MAG: EAL domain-containing protein [Actinobacteria bacterium]|nr:MAG: EAL domain-containing protein [Actinomycetota bacterium]